MTTEFLSVAELRELAGQYLDLATDGAKGRPESDPIYRAITENRDTGRAYSSCGDLVHWLYFRLGIRGAWLNRAEHLGWKRGLNIARLVYRCPDARKVRPDEQFELGDVLVVWNKRDGTDAHVLVVRSQGAGVLLSADGGQPGTKRRERPVTEDGQLATKKMQIVIRFRDVIEGAFGRGELSRPESVSDWLASLAAPERPTLRKGATGDAVRLLQRKLKITTDGAFGPKTHAAVAAFQAARGLVVDGVVGPVTWRELG